MSNFKRVKEIINTVAIEAVKACPDTPNEDYYATQICQLFETAGEDRLLEEVEIGDALDLEEDGRYPCSDGRITYTMDVSNLLKAQASKVERIKDAECQERLNDLINNLHAIYNQGGDLRVMERLLRDFLSERTNDA